MKVKSLIGIAYVFTWTKLHMKSSLFLVTAVAEYCLLQRKTIYTTGQKAFPYTCYTWVNYHFQLAVTFQSKDQRVD